MRPLILAALVTFASSPLSSFAWDPAEVSDLDAKSQAAIAAMKEKDPSMQRFFDAANAYVVIPTVAKGGLGVGGARGKGLLYEDGKPTAIVTMTQLTLGFQAGGQAYSEFMFFQDKNATDNFKRGNFELNAQASAVAVTAGASADLNFTNGVAIFTQAKGGLMYEASVGGQKFKVEAQ